MIFRSNDIITPEEDISNYIPLVKEIFNKQIFLQAISILRNEIKHRKFQKKQICNKLPPNDSSNHSTEQTMECPW